MNILKKHPGVSKQEAAAHLTALTALAEGQSRGTRVNVALQLENLRQLDYVRRKFSTPWYDASAPKPYAKYYLGIRGWEALESHGKHCL